MCQARDVLLYRSAIFPVFRDTQSSIILALYGRSEAYEYICIAIVCKHRRWDERLVGPARRRLWRVAGRHGSFDLRSQK